MNRRWDVGGFLLSAWLLSACALSSPTARLDAYLGPSVPDRSAEACVSRDAGLLVVHDTTGKGSLPPQSVDGLRSLSARIKPLVERALPLNVVKIATPVVDAGDTPTVLWKRVAEEQGVGALLLAVVSVVEVTGADQFPLDGTQEGGGAMGVLPGRWASDYALVELGLLDTKGDRLLARAEGRGSATLEQLATDLSSNAYPVIRQPGNARRIFPPRDGGGNPQSLVAVVAIEEALGQALDKLPRCPNR